MGILKGVIYITDNPDVVYNADLKKTKIIDMHEDGILQDNNEFIGGTCLLPPIESKIAEVDNNEWQYDQFYRSHLLEPYQMQFLSALISYLYKGGCLILFLPDSYDNTRDKLLQHLWELYGIHVGIIGDKNFDRSICYYDEKCVVMWMNMIYSSRVISAQEYLFVIPNDAVITNNSQVLNQLIEELMPYGNSINEKVNTLERYRQLVKQNPNVKPGIIGVC